ncbi:MAG TPA: hypothetical protein VGX96_15115 [Candidatus Elarobacter sp.]|jgi:hypothetical protein|nr:hypothetical protein [Candidatus Elarobacter sp.]
MIFRRRFVAGTFALLTALAVPAAVRADQAYAVTGRDTFRVGSGEVHSETVYHGVQRLTIARKGTTTTYVANVEYDREGDGGRQHQRASFTSTLLPSGEQKDGPAADPDYLTVLNQPFAVQLDVPTMRDLRHVKRAVPFDFPSPMTGAPLRGTLRRLPDAMVGGNRAMGIAFEAKGPLHGALPDRPTMQLAGTITMKGTAYYDYSTALLVGLDATLAIDGNLDDSARHSPVSIVYARSIRTATGQQAARITPAPQRT